MFFLLVLVSSVVTLTNGLSRTIWQKNSVLHTDGAAADHSTAVRVGSICAHTGFLERSVYPQSAVRIDMSLPFTTIGEERFVSLTTFRKSGEPVSSPVWIASDGEALIVTTPAGSGKVKRLRNDTTVELRPCSRRGQVQDGASSITGTASVLSTPADVQKLSEVFRDKYRLEYRIFMAIERLGRSGSKSRVILRIVPSQH